MREAWKSDNFTAERVEEWDRRLATVFNRGFWDGYYLGQRLGEWSSNYGSLATKRKIYLGKGTNYFPNIQVAEFKLETGNLQVGDEILVIGPTTGVVEATVGELRVELEQVQEARKGESFSIHLPQKIRRSDKIFKLVDAKTIRENVRK